MAGQHYHLVCEGFRDSQVNKTELSLALKNQLKLSDAQIADLMASRRFILARNLPKEKARLLGSKLVKAGLIIKAESFEANQKLSAEELRQHLLDGGLSHYFAGRYRHPKDDMETRLSLILLAALPVICYLLLPLIGLLLLKPLLAIHIWSGQTLAALGQLWLVVLCFAPLALLRPAPVPNSRAGVELDAENELLLYAIVEEVTQYLHGPAIKNLYLTDAPVIRVRQSTLQWLRREADLEIGLAHLQSMNMQQLVGSLVYQLTPLSPGFYYWCWGLHGAWFRHLESRLPAAVDWLLPWLQPMYEHQKQRQSSSVQALIGPRQALHLTRLYQQLEPLLQHWEAFSQFCQQQQKSATDWTAWFSLPKSTEQSTATEVTEGQFRMNAPAHWVLSNSAGYQKALLRLDAKPREAEAAQALWQSFTRVT